MLDQIFSWKILLIKISLGNFFGTHEKLKIYGFILSEKCNMAISRLGLGDVK